MRWSGITICFLTVCLTAGADAPRPQSGDALDVVLLADQAPIVVRWRVEIDGQPFSAVWRRYLDRLFADLDHDNDGTLSKSEAARVPSIEFLQAFLQGNLNLEAASEAVPFDRLDADRDGRVSRTEFTKFAERYGFERVQVLPAADHGQAGPLTDVLLHLLDFDRDGRLSADELKQASRTLGRLDLDGNEWLTPDELLLHRPAKAVPARHVTLEALGFLPLLDSGLPEISSRAVLAHYAAGGKFDAGKLKALLREPPQREVVVRLGKVTADQPRSELVKPVGARRADERTLLVDAGGVTLEVLTGPADGSVRGLHAFYRQQFEAADSDQRGFLERKQVTDAPTLAALFLLADRDADGKLSSKEFDAFLDLHALGAASFVSLSVADQSLGLFDLLDERRDDWLSLQELQTAWERLRGFDRNGDGRISRDEFPRQLRARLAPGKPSSRPARPITATTTTPTPRGPAWFQKMDRNGDGLVSRREFLGPEKLFGELDTNGDGLLSPDEAERAAK
ncbi:MAG: EF-hand domain-containing protein [Planctomycetia bacterium]|nr:EF-hand domain-containing protein [Planctomycetia bacterium]